LFIVGIIGFDAALFYLGIIEQTGITELIIFGLIAGILILGSILLHELMHSIVAQHNGLPVLEIELFIFGGVSKITEEPKSPGTEFKIAVVGPTTSILLGMGLIGLSFINIPYVPVLLMLIYVGVVNVGLGLFNLVPAFPMDGGRILRSLLWKRKKNMISATRTASRIGSFFGYIFMGIGLLQMFFLGNFSGLWMLFIGNYLNSNAKNSYIQAIYLESLSNLKTYEIMGGISPIIPYNTMLDEAIREYFLRFRRNHFLVALDDRIIGVIHMERVKNIPFENRSRMVVGDITEEILEIPSVKSNINGRDALALLSNSSKKTDLLVVMEEESSDIIGFLESEDFQRAISLTQLSSLS
jgi:Zn-dependent protease